MNKTKTQIILTATVLGALLGLGVGVVVTESKKEQLMLADSYGEKAAVKPGIREWIGVAVAGVTLLRQLANMLTPKV